MQRLTSAGRKRRKSPPLLSIFRRGGLPVNRLKIESRAGPAEKERGRVTRRETRERIYPGSDLLTRSRDVTGSPVA